MHTGPDVTGTSDSESGIDVVVSDRLGYSAASQVLQAGLVLVSSSSSRREGEAAGRRSATCQLPGPQRLHCWHGTRPSHAITLSLISAITLSVYCRTVTRTHQEMR